jgi:hypothetical protein
VYNICVLSNTHDNITGIEIMMNEVARMNILQVTELCRNLSISNMSSELKSTNQLSSYKQNSLHHETRMAVIKEVLERPAEAIEGHRIEASLCAKPMDVRDTSPSIKLHVDMKLMAEGANLSFRLLKFDDDIIPS